MSPEFWIEVARTVVLGLSAAGAAYSFIALQRRQSEKLKIEASRADLKRRQPILSIDIRVVENPEESQPWGVIITLENKGEQLLKTEFQLDAFVCARLRPCENAHCGFDVLFRAEPWCISNFLPDRSINLEQKLRSKNSIDSGLQKEGVSENNMSILNFFEELMVRISGVSSDESHTPEQELDKKKREVKSQAYGNYISGKTKFEFRLFRPGQSRQLAFGIPRLSNGTYFLQFHTKYARTDANGKPCEDSETVDAYHQTIYVVNAATRNR